MEEKFNIGDIVKFDISGTELSGTGEVLGKASNGICPTWIVLIKDRYTEKILGIKEKALVVQENFMEILLPHDALSQSNDELQGLDAVGGKL